MNGNACRKLFSDKNHSTVLEMLHIPLRENEEKLTTDFSHILNELRCAFFVDFLTFNFKKIIFRFLLAVICSKSPKQEFSLGTFYFGHFITFFFNGQPYIVRGSFSILFLSFFRLLPLPTRREQDLSVWRSSSLVSIHSSMRLFPLWADFMLVAIQLKSS